MILKVTYENEETSEYEFENSEALAVQWLMLHAKEHIQIVLDKRRLSIINSIIDILNCDYFQDEFWFILNYEKGKLFKIKKFKPINDTKWTHK